MVSVVSLWSGLGGMDKAARDAGIEVKASYDVNKIACASYAFVNGSPCICTDLDDYPIEDIPDADGIIGGPPCQTFSQSNYFGKIEGSLNKWPKTLEIVRVKMPRFFVFENVTGLAYRNWQYFYFILDQFKSMGYKTSWAILNAADYGVPQTRERVFITGYLGKDVPWKFPTPTHAGRWKSWSSCVPDSWYDTAKVGTMPDFVGRLPHYSPLPDGYYNTREVSHVSVHRNPDQPAYTVLTEFNRIRIVRDRVVYRADAALMARLQDLPFHEDMSFEVIGNAVPPGLARELFCEIVAANP